MEMKSAQKGSEAWILIVLLLDCHFSVQKLEPVVKAMQIRTIGSMSYT